MDTARNTAAGAVMSSRVEERVRTRPSDRISDAQYFERFKSRCKITTAGCWVMPGCQRVSKGMRPGAPGYVQISYRGARWAAHRIMYRLAFGEIPAGNVIAHRCDNPPCCNPEHLISMTQLENAADMIAKRRNFEQQRTHCPAGHEYNEENTYWLPAASGRMARNCKACSRMHWRIRAGWSPDLAASLPPVDRSKYSRRKGAVTKVQR